MPSFPLGRVLNPPVDIKDKEHPFSVVLSLVTEPIPPSKSWRRGPLRNNQGNIGACVAFAGGNWRQGKPISTIITNESCLSDYYECKKIDNMPNEEGTYDRALMKVYEAQGRISRYLWAQNPTELKNWILTTGPVLIGTNWYESMFDPDEYGFVHISGQIAGGHETCVRGFNNPRKAFRVTNSWGANWGLDGEFWIKENDLYRLVFDENGDACTAIEKRP